MVGEEGSEGTEGLMDREEDSEDREEAGDIRTAGFGRRPRQEQTESGSTTLRPSRLLGGRSGDEDGAGAGSPLTGESPTPPSHLLHPRPPSPSRRQPRRRRTSPRRLARRATRRRMRRATRKTARGRGEPDAGGAEAVGEVGTLRNTVCPVSRRYRLLRRPEHPRRRLRRPGRPRRRSLPRRRCPLSLPSPRIPQKLPQRRSPPNPLPVRRTRRLAMQQTVRRTTPMGRRTGRRRDRGGSGLAARWLTFGAY